MISHNIFHIFVFFWIWIDVCEEASPISSEKKQREQRNLPDWQEARKMEGETQPLEHWFRSFCSFRFGVCSIWCPSMEASPGEEERVNKGVIPAVRAARVEALVEQRRGRIVPSAPKSSSFRRAARSICNKSQRGRDGKSCQRQFNQRKVVFFFLFSLSLIYYQVI